MKKNIWWMILIIVLIIIIGGFYFYKIKLSQIDDRISFILRPIPMGERTEQLEVELGKEIIDSGILFIPVEWMSSDRTKKLCNQAGGDIKEGEKRFRNRVFENDIALIFLGTKDYKVNPEAMDYIRNLDSTYTNIDFYGISPHILIGDLSRNVADQIIGKYTIQGVYYKDDKINPKLVSSFSNKFKNFIGYWNKGYFRDWRNDDVYVNCKCPDGETWSWDGCVMINQKVCEEGGGGWINNNCKCIGRWNNLLGKCETPCCA